MEERPESASSLKALIVRFSAIGDCVMAVPVANSIREKYPDAHIEWAIEPWCAPVVDTSRLVSRTAIFPRDEWQDHRWSPGTWWNQLRTYTALRKGHFDIGVDLQGQAKTALCLRIAKPRKRIAILGHDYLSKHLNPLLNIPRKSMHVVEANLKALAFLGDFSQTAKFVMPDLAREKATVKSKLPSGKIASISVGSGQPKKTYPIAMWEATAKLLIANDYNVVWLGSKKDQHPTIEGPTDLIGQLSLSESMAVVTMSDVHLAADTGSGHMAAAYDVPVVSVFGATPANVFRPYAKCGIVLDGKGSPTNISPEQLVEAVRQLSEGRGETLPH